MKIKSIISLLIMIALVLATLPASAGLETFNLGTNTVVGATATNFNATAGTVSAPKSTDITIQCSSTSLSSDTSTKTWVFNGSVDNTTWTSNVLAVTYAGLGTVKASGITNLPPGYRYPYLRLHYVTNAAASVVMTNMTAKVWLK